ncbi:MAG TPA: N-acetyl-gamma-glutamyl-phosphate reductase [Gemmatimonadales bacterium]|jgi:N-acetyl-gamma-glutamyl-phosphate reductase|nr:N-acetyl-gamma-glutamyl-phosphate reductase [Gemmatimonadales bacterium]
MTLRVAVIGAGGYVGGELLRVLLGHPEVGEIVAVSRSRAGTPVAEVHPGLLPLTDLRFSGAAPAEAASGRDVVFLALEHGESSRVMEEVLAAGPGLVIDLAADFRVNDLELYRQYYGPHPRPDLVPRFTYALADVLGRALAGKPALAVPGCFATAAALALYPLARSGLEVWPALFGVTGSSGSGIQPKATTHHPARAHNLFAYSVLQHRHEAEILQAWRGWTGRPQARARLMTHSGPFVRGIHLTLHARLPESRGAEIAASYASAFAGRPFVRVLAAPPELTHVVGTNYALLHAAASEDGQELQVMCVVDNLVKGAGGQAVQAMNLALGIAEDSGLRFGAVFPC